MSRDDNECIFIAVVILLLAVFACWLVWEFITQAWDMNWQLLR